jgi:ribosomal protein S18 acetylase RimI-like enzyme
MSIPRELAASLPRFHERQERQESLNVVAAGLGPEVGVEMHDWGDGLWSVRCGEAPGHVPGNQIVGFEPGLVDRLPELLAWFDDAACSVRIRLPGPSVDRELGARLAGLGFALHELEAWMAAPLDGLVIPSRPHDLREVDAPAAMQHFRDAFCAGWAITSADTRRIALAAMAPEPAPTGWRHYVGHVDGAPAAQALLVHHGEVAYLAQAATDPRFRRQGLQRALIARRAADAHAAGATVLFSAVRYGDQSWGNMRALGLREEFLTVTLRRPARQ